MPTSAYTIEISYFRVLLTPAGSLWENLTYGTKVDVLSGEPSEHERYVWTTALAMGLAHVYFDEWMAVSRQVVGIPATAANASTRTSARTHTNTLAQTLLQLEPNPESLIKNVAAVRLPMKTRVLPLFSLFVSFAAASAFSCADSSRGHTYMCTHK